MPTLNIIKMERNNITIYPEKKLREELDKRAEKEDRSLNNLILGILKKEMKIK